MKALLILAISVAVGGSPADKRFIRSNNRFIRGTNDDPLVLVLEKQALKIPLEQFDEDAYLIQVTHSITGRIG